MQRLTIRIVDLLFESRKAPRICVLVFVEERIDLLILLVIRELRIVGHFEE